MTGRRIDGVVIGVLMGIDTSGAPLVVFPGNLCEAAVPAKSTLPLERGDIGAELALMFEAGDARRPIVMGRMHKPENGLELPVRTQFDRVDLSDQDQLTLRCGKASITLTKEGKIILRGTYISSRSSGPNRIKGGSVHLN